MRSSILIAFLVVAISSSTYGAGDIFGVPINPDELHTLKAADVAAEVEAKLNLTTEIEKLIKKVPTDERTWLNEFRKMITAEREMVERLNVPLTQINTDNLKQLNNEELKKLISEEVLKKLQKGLQDYLDMLKTFDFSETVWLDRSFLGNPFAEFMEKITALDAEGLKAATLKEAFMKAAKDVNQAKRAIFGTVKSFKANLRRQYRQSKRVMIEIRNLNLLAVAATEKKVKESVDSLTKKLKKLQSAIENVNEIPTAFKCFMEKRAWIDEIRQQFINIDKIHANLNIELARI